MGLMLLVARLTPDCPPPLTGVGVVDAPRRPQAQEADRHDNSHGHSRHPRPRQPPTLHLHGTKHGPSR